MLQKVDEAQGQYLCMIASLDLDKQDWPTLHPGFEPTLTLWNLRAADDPMWKKDGGDEAMWNKNGDEAVWNKMEERGILFFRYH